MQLEHARGQYLPPPTNLNCYNQNTICQDTERKNKPNQTNQLFRAVVPYTSTEGVTQRATNIFPKYFLLQNATGSSIPLPESLTIDCFSLAFLRCHILSAFNFASNSSKKDGAASLLPAVTTMQTEEI